MIPRWRRWGMAGIGLVLAVLAEAFWQTRGNAEILPALWPIIFAVAAAMTIALAVAPRTRWLFVTVAGLVFFGLATRPIGVAANWAAGSVRSGWSIVASAVFCWSLCLAWVEFWLGKVKPWHVRHRAGAEALAKGD